MPSEDVTLRTRAGAVGRGRAVVVRYGRSRRIATGAGIVLAGVLVGLPTLVVPLVHFVAPWLVPLLAAGFALHVVRARGRVERVEGACPGCGGAITEGPLGAIADDPMWVRCEGCGSPVELRLEEAS